MCEAERLAVPPAHSVFSQHSHSGASSVAAPPFAPRPHYAARPPRPTPASSSRSGAASDRAPPSAVTTASSSSSAAAASAECGVHEVCYYFQQVVFILAIMTGAALVVAGAVMHVQSGELLVLVYIGVLLGAVNTVLLTIQCCVRRKQKRRSRAYRTGRAARAPRPPAEHPATNNPLLMEPYPYKQPHYVAPFQDFPQQPPPPQQSPTESQALFLHGIPYHRSGSIASHHRHAAAKGVYQKSPPLGQVHRPLLNTLGPPQLRSSEGDSYLPSAPPPSYDDLLRSGRMPHEGGPGTTVHLI